MNTEDIIRMAREAGLSNDFGNLGYPYLPELERFANLVAAAERERIKWDTIHSCHPECDKPVCVAIRKAVEAEREACAKTCEELRLFDRDKIGYSEAPYKLCALGIRERGAP